ncbi:cellulose binding domain-containing protein [Microbispora sp. RL4-1S]|uniref:Cellulose binding domain-containing protein n=1 Tax=Microbispora oryzae TaxID=2806554 RepID=A0A940WMX6_9ACTN|nr:cellulose binding domain-containing protein [Microbispora oryzae]MBP2707843.1 cellulose binding domain-containing protein [Microbispora oryzae]
MKMRMITASLALLGSVAASLVVGQAARADTTICEKYGSTTVQGGKYVVMNNVWGSSAPQCINVTNSGFTVTQAGHNNTGGTPAAYPAIYAGCHYANCSTGSGLPMQASSSQFNNVQTSVSMSYPGSGIYDAAYDIWFDPTPRTDGQNTGAEIMVWLNHTGSVQPVGSRRATVNLAGGTWDVWEGNIGWNVISYVRTSPTNSISFPVRTFYDDAVNRGYAQRSWYLTSVQAGFEPWVGGTGLAVNNFSYSVGGSVSSPSPSASASPRPGGGACRVTYSKSEWQGGFTANLTIANNGSSAINGWTLGFTFPNGQQVTQAWSATVTQSGSSVTARNMSYNASIPAGGSTSFGFQGTWNGANGNPTNYTLNGTACTAG